MRDTRLIGRDGCFMCEMPRENIVAVRGGALLIKRTTPDGVVVDNMFHILPAQHIVDVRLLPAGCTSGAWQLLEELEQFGKMPMTRYSSDGYDAGQRVEHWHEWIWFRTDNTQLGPYGIFQKYEQLLALEAVRCRSAEAIDPATSGLPH